MCPFCNPAAGRVSVLMTEHYFAMFDRAPVTKGHLLVISREHRADISHLGRSEWDDLGHAIRCAMKYLDELYPCDGYNIGTNCGEAAGQTVMHFHMHVIPRHKGDVVNPQGGVRNLMPPLQPLWPEE